MDSLLSEKIMTESCQDKDKKLSTIIYYLAFFALKLSALYLKISTGDEYLSYDYQIINIKQVKRHKGNIPTYLECVFLFLHFPTTLY